MARIFRFAPGRSPLYFFGNYRFDDPLDSFGVVCAAEHLAGAFVETSAGQSHLIAVLICSSGTSPVFAQQWSPPRLW